MITQLFKHEPSPVINTLTHIKIAQCNFLIMRGEHNSYDDWRRTIKQITYLIPNSRAVRERRPQEHNYFKHILWDLFLHPFMTSKGIIQRKWTVCFPTEMWLSNSFPLSST